MSDSGTLLTDRQVQRFIAEGYLLVRADAPELHAGIYRKLEAMFEKEGNPGNNLLPRIPEIQEVFEHPAVQGALTSLLGPGYLMNPHRHPHLNAPGSAGQSWHKDCYVFDHNLRKPRFQWVLALYYPQDVTGEMGPTAILPRRHHYAEISDADPSRCREEAMPLCGPAGTVALVDFDAWHRATPNTSDRKRYMLKFQFARMREPEAPTWCHRSVEWEVPLTPEQAPVCRDVWDWLRGSTGNHPKPRGAFDELELRRLREGSEEERLAAAYELGGRRAGSGSLLLEELRREARMHEAGIEVKTPDNLHGTNPTAGPAAQALLARGAGGVPTLIEGLADEHWLTRALAADLLGSQARDAVPAAEALEARLGDEHWWVRRNAAEALGRLGPTGAAVALVPCLSDEDRRVRRVAALALAQLGGPAEGAVPALGRMLRDEDRYNRFYAALALRSLPDPAAREVLLDELFTARWCPLTTAESRY